MIKLSQHIEYLLSCHDCVIIPGWGAMIGHYVSAHFDDNTGRLVPPARYVTFNPALSHNDGLLANSVMRRHGLCYENACKAIEDEVNTLRHQLSTDGEVAIERVGLFKRVDNGTPQFEAAGNSLFNSRFAALPVLNLKQVKEVAKNDAAASIDAKEPERLTFNRFRHGILQIAASIAIIICAVSALTLPLGSGCATTISTASLGFNFDRTADNPVPVEEESPVELSLCIAIPGASSKSVIDTTSRAMYRKALAQQSVNVAKEPVKPRQATRKATAEKADATPVLTIDDSQSYCLIVSSHTSREEAEKYISGHSSNPMKILEQDGKYRVYIATGDTGAGTRKYLDSPSLRAKYPGAWVCARHQ